MKLFYSPASPFIRKVLVVAHELGIADQLTHLPSAAHPVRRDPRVVAVNPSGRVPALILDDGEVLYDSRVICEYLEARAGGAGVFPPPGLERWRALRQQSLGDGLMEAAVGARYERYVRPENLRWEDWWQGCMAKVTSSLDAIEVELKSARDGFDIGHVTLACALAYLDFRYSDFGWRQGRPVSAAWFDAINQRASMRATRHGEMPA
ncbi:MAG: glutathione S-transferase [Castellaniella sp.]|nr:glutathione S-transferase [Castellaniella sp.]